MSVIATIRTSLMVCVGVVGLSAAEGDLAQSVAAARSGAETVLAEERARILTERTALTQRLQEIHREAAAARARLDEAGAAHEAVRKDLERLRRDHHQAAATLRSLVDRAVIGARLDDDATRAVARGTPRERAAAAVAAAAARVTALRDRLAARFATERVVTRDGTLHDLPVLRLAEARALALGSNDHQRGLLVRDGDGGWRVAGPALPLTQATAMPTTIVLDPDGTVAASEALQHKTLKEWIAAGRFFIWPILATLIIGLLVSLERILAYLRLRVNPGRLLRLAGLLRQGDHAAAEALVATGATPLDRVVAIGLAVRERSRDTREAAVDQALLAEAPRLQRGLGIILVMAGIAPLLGLLGTVTGMIDMFGVIAQQGSGSAKSLSGAISEALVCTQAGMIAAIPLLLLHAAFTRIADRRLMLLEEAACAVLGLEPNADAAKPAKTSLVGAEA